MTLSLTELLEHARSLPPSDRLTIIEELAASLRTTSDLMQVEPLPPKQVIETGLVGTWADQDISDGAEWVNERKQERRERRKW